MRGILRTEKVTESASHPRHRAVSVPLARYFDLDKPLLRSFTPERVLMSYCRLASTGRCGPDSRPAQLLYSHECGAEVRVPQGVARIGPGLKRAAILWPNLRSIDKCGLSTLNFQFDGWVGGGEKRVLEDEKPPYS